jgi:glutamate-1-semialdehyde 2,1-aminomutase
MGKARLPHGYPQFHHRAEGSVIWDVDGNRYIDLMCSWGPIILGHRHPEVEKAASAQLALGDTLNGPSRQAVELAELLSNRAGHDWAMFMKNGTDATTVAVTVARAATGKQQVLVAQGAYHGSAPWCTPNLTGVTNFERQAIAYFAYNDIDSVLQAIASHDDDVAAIVVTPFRHDAGFDQEMPTPEFVRALRDIATRRGIVLILDEVRAGFRLSAGGSWSSFGVEPDLAAWGKALGNGYPIAAVTGIEALRDGSERIFSTGSYWLSAVPMAAAVATLNVLEQVDGPAQMELAGNRLRDGIARIAESHGVVVRQTGPSQMPYLSFVGDTSGRLLNDFAIASLREGVYLHPRHNWFLSTAHTSESIDSALEAIDRAFVTLEPYVDQVEAAKPR